MYLYLLGAKKTSRKKWLMALCLALVLSAVCDVTFGAEIRAAILDSGYSLSYFSRPVEEHRWRLEHWQNYLRSRGIEQRIINDAWLERGCLNFNLLILPEAIVLSAEQTRVIKEFVAKGNALIFTKATGSERFSRGEPDYRTLQEILELDYEDVPGEQITNETTWLLKVPSILTANIPPGQILSVNVEKGIGRVKIKGKSVMPAAYWVNSVTLLLDKNWYTNAALAAGSLGSGRYFWMGFAIDSIGGDLETQAAFSILLDNALDWLMKKPVLEKNPWPGDYQASIVFSQDTETSFRNSLRIIKIMETLDVPLTCFIATDMVNARMETMQKIIQNPNVEVAVHIDTHDVFKGQEKEVQFNRLSGAKSFLEKLGRKRVIGFRPPAEEYDFFTLESLVEAGYKYMFADHMPDRCCPKVINVKGTEFVLLPFLNKDDIKLIIYPRLTDCEKILKDYIADIDRIFSLGGLYLCDFHTHILAREKYAPVLSSVIRYAKEKGAWITTCAKVAEWWKLRRKIMAEIETARRGSLVIKIENSGTGKVDGLSFSLWFPYRVYSVKVEPVSAGLVVSEYKLENERLSFHLPTIGPQQIKRLKVKWAE